MTDEDQAPKGSTRWDKPPELRDASETAQIARGRDTEGAGAVGKPLVMVIGHDFLPGLRTHRIEARPDPMGGDPLPAIPAKVDMDRCRICRRKEPGHPETPPTVKPPTNELERALPTRRGLGALIP